MKSFKQFIHTTRDIFKIYWEIAPWLTTGVLVTQILLSFQGIINAYLFGVLIDQILGIVNTTKHLQDIIPIIFFFGLINLFLTVIELIGDYLQTLLSNIDNAKLRIKHVNFMTSLGVSQMENADLTNKSTRFVEVYTSMGTHLNLLMALIAMIVSTIAYATTIYSFANIIIWLSLLVFAIKYINNSKYISKLFRFSRDATEVRRNAWGSVNYLGDPTSLKEIIPSGGVNFLKNKFMEYVHWQNGAYTKIRTEWLFFQLLQAGTNTVLLAFGVYLLADQTIAGAVSIGAFTFYLRSLFSYSGQLDTLSYRIARAFESSIRLSDALELFELYKPEKDGTKELEISKIPPTIELSNVSFKYPNGKYPVIKDLNLTIKPGERIAIVGENGAGKTTLVKLLTRIYRPQEGTITLDTLPITDITRESLHTHLGVLFQDFNKYENLTVSENVQMGKVTKKVDDDKIKGALVKADALSFVKKYPKELHQILSERFKGGIRPSGGQWQKIAIARFFYRNAPILIMDEPTASIDAVSEAQIFDNIYKFMKGKTVIIISHRFSTVRNADRILVLDKGRIIEEGTHQELLQLDGKYAHAFKLQAKGYS
jgi:ATP-binding cassette subfamily B protein